MEIPSDIDRLLSSILDEAKPTSNGRLSVEDRAFLNRMIQAIDSGSKGVFVVVNPDNSLDYLIANETRIGAIALLARMIQRTARHIEADR